MGRFPIDLEVAGRFLSSIPLLSLEEPLIPKRLDAVLRLERQVSDSNRSSSGAPEDVASLDLGGLAHLDVKKAERFLTSLELDAREAGESAENANSLDFCKALPSTSPAACPKEKDKWLTVVGGWRNASDLDRLMPALLRKGLLGGRMIATTRQSSSYVCSTFPMQLDAATVGATGSDGALAGRGKHRAKLQRARRSRLEQLGCCRLRRRSMSQKQVAGVSYGRFLEPSSGRLLKSAGQYDPDFLDDQRLRQGKHHTVLRLESYQVSVIPFVRPRRLKEELNDQFRSAHPHIHPSITLSKLRNLQKDMRNIAATVEELDMSTVATAWVYFEKLVLADHVRKANRKLLAGACLILAFKFNQPSGSRDKETSEQASLKKLAERIRKLDRKDHLDQSALLDAEVKAFVWLEFSLHLQRAEVIPHLHRMLKDSGETPEHYYGPETTSIVNEEWRFLDGLDDVDGGERGMRKARHSSPMLTSWAPPARAPERLQLETQVSRESIGPR